MTFSFLSALGGVGLFLIGMLLLTDGLKAIAGRRMRRVLAGFTSTPVSGAATGALTTAVIQSSSATTVAAVGFVASSLLTFPQALGIIFGANVGTTLTGWIVAVLGFKLDLGQVALPFVFVGAVLRLTVRGNLAHAGQAIAGFCLIFIGIESMKDGLDAFSGVVTPVDFPPDTIVGRLQLVFAGVLITLVTQSSSAGVVTALAALGAGAINFPQAASLVIGMDVGTTFTAALATLGGGTMAKRTGYAHVIYNFMTGGMAFFLLTPFSAFVAPWVGTGNAQIALVAFHSFFNFLGVVLILPFARPFARLIENIVPEKGSTLTRSLDAMVLRDPNAAVLLAWKTVSNLSSAVVDHLRNKLGVSVEAAEDHSRETLQAAILETRDFLDRIDVPKEDANLLNQMKGMFHVLDHLGRLLYRCDQTARIRELSQDHRLKRLAAILEAVTKNHTTPTNTAACERQLQRLHILIRNQRQIRRDALMMEVASDKVSVETVWIRLDALRWLYRVTYHLWRIRLHLNVITSQSPLVSLDDKSGIEAEED
ncbi:Na/Pi-cotransporter II-related protein [Roseibium album]|nr:Na/Pi-cotransporter II-related protein [Roseibium album]